MRLLRVQRFLLGCLLLAGFSGCNTTKFLDIDEFLVKKNVLLFKPVEKIENKRSLSYELSTLYKQQPNGKFFFIPREWFYFKTQDPGDTTRLDGWTKRFLAEQPAIFDERLMETTAEEMTLYLQYKGYFDAKVRLDDQVKKKKVTVRYVVEPNFRYRIDTIAFRSDDANIDTLLQQIRANTLYKKGEALDGRLYELEKDRISKFLRNDGYANFVSNYVGQMEVDTFRDTHVGKVLFEVLPPSNDSSHQQYFIGDIVVLPEFDPTKGDSVLVDTLIDGLIYRSLDRKFRIRPASLRNTIYFRTGELYRQEDYDRTNNGLGALGVFKFVRIKVEPDSIFPNKLNVRIELPPLQQFELIMDLEFNYTNRSNAAGIGNLIGLSLGPSLRNRNLFAGAESLTTKVTAGVEINPTPERRRFWNTIDLRLQNDLHLPRFRDYSHFWKGMGLLTGSAKRENEGLDFYTQLKQNGTSRFSANLNYVSLLDFYSYYLMNASYGYDLQVGNTHRYTINQIGIDYLNPAFERAADTILNENNYFKNSFSRQLFVSLLFRDFTFTNAGRPNRRGISHYWGVSVETSGFELWAGNALYNQFSGKPDTLKIGGVPFSQFFRLDGDWRVYRQLTPKNSLAARFNFGLVRPFGYSRQVHYVKQFFVGGPNSIRGWRARELGPGGHIDSLTLNTDFPLFFYQSGEMKLELNLEYRFNIFWRLNGAFFLDAGNTWTITKDTTRPGSAFRFREGPLPETPPGKGLNDPFWRQIAISPGIGARMDFTYFIFRFDLGFKMRYPYRWDGERFWNTPKRMFRDPNINLGLGLPF